MRRCSRSVRIVRTGQRVMVVGATVLAGTAMASSHDESTHVVIDAGGAHDARVLIPSVPSSARPAPPLEAQGGCEVVWTRNVIDPVYTTTGISAPAGGLIAGTYLNPPKHAEFQPLEGTGVPDWEFPLDTVQVAASRDGTVLAATDAFGGDVVLHRLEPASATPLWSATIKGANPGSFRTVLVSNDGSTIAVLVTIPGAAAHAELHLFDAGSATPVSVTVAPDGTFGRNLAISTDGAFVAFIAGATVFVVDRDADSVRYSVSAGASTDNIGLSGDGSVLSYGWQTLSVRRWNGSTYEVAFTTGGPSTFMSVCTPSDDGTTLATAWYSGSFDQNIVRVFDTLTGSPAWTYTYTQGSGPYQDIIKDFDFTGAGDLLAAASWGDQPGTNDEIHVFDAATGDVVYALDTPGSMFDVDIARTSGGAVSVAACGKHIHANESGRGGDLYSVRLDASCLGCLGDIDADGMVGVSDLLAVLAAWGDCPGCAADLDGDGMVGVSDLLTVLAAWGPC